MRCTVSSMGVSLGELVGGAASQTRPQRQLAFISRFSRPVHAVWCTVPATCMSANGGRRESCTLNSPEKKYIEEMGEEKKAGKSVLY